MERDNFSVQVNEVSDRDLRRTHRLMKNNVSLIEIWRAGLRVWEDIKNLLPINNETGL